jgi:hypothetical protein
MGTVWHTAFLVHNLSKQDCFLQHRWPADTDIQWPWHQCQLNSATAEPSETFILLSRETSWHTHKDSHCVAWQHLSTCGVHVHCAGHTALCARRCQAVPHTAQTWHVTMSFPCVQLPKGSRFVLDKRHQGCNGFKISHGSPLQRGSINWCFNGMPASAPMGAVSNCLHTSAQNNPWMDFIWTSLMHYSTVWKNENVNVTSLRWHPCKYRLYRLQALVRQAIK